MTRTDSFYMIILFITIYSCSKIIIKRNFQYYEAANHNIEKPFFLKSNVVLESVETSKVFNYYWIEYVPYDTLIRNMYRFNIYNVKGKFLGGYYYSLIDINLFKDKKIFYDVVYNESNDYRLNRVNFKEFSLQSDSSNNTFLITGGVKFLMDEYIPRDMVGSKERKFYYEWLRPEIISSHAVLYEDVSSDFDYSWRVFIGADKLENKSQRIKFEEFNYSGTESKFFSFVIETNDEINLENYSFMKSLFIDENIFINNGELYKMGSVTEDDKN
jgi:hypothetical protein